MSSNAVSDYHNFDTSSMIFAKEVRKDIQNESGPPIRFYRIPISVRRADGSVGKLIFAPSDLFTFGVSVNKDPKRGEITGYTLPLTLWNKEGPTEDQESFITTMENVLSACKEHLVAVRKTIAKPNLTIDSLVDLDKLLYYKLGDDGERVPGRGPAMYPKLFTSTKGGLMEITTGFIDSNGNDIDPMTLVGKYGHTSPAIFIDNIYIGAKISLQVYVGEAIVKLVSTGHRGILQRPKADETMGMGETFQPPRGLAAAPVQVAPPVSEPVEGDDQIVDDELVVDDTPPPPRAAPKRLPQKKKA
jgi:hypothetical protein